MEGTDPVTPPIPPSYLVLEKLKQWDECALNDLHDQSTRLARKELTISLQNLRYSKPKFHHDPNYDRNLHNESVVRVNRFLSAHNIYVKEWQQMGFGKNPELSASNTSTSAVPEGRVQPRRRKLSLMDIRWLAAQTTVAILAELGFPCAIFGSMACKLYGNQRLPNVRSVYVSKFTLTIC